MSATLIWPGRPEALRVIGRPIARAEGVAKVTGAAPYAADVIPADALWAKVLHSPVPHARIKRIDVSAARQAPGVRAVLTADDVPDRLLGQRVMDTPILARDVVRYVGDRVAAVAADDLVSAELALNLIEVEYEDLPAVFDEMEAQAPSAPVLHPEFAGYKRPEHTTDPSQRNLQSVTRFSMGDVDRAFSESDFVFEHEFHTQMVHQGYIEPRCCTVEIVEDGRIHVWIADQSPYKVRQHLAHAVERDPEAILVHPVSIGASFGAKDDVMDAPLAYCLARATGRPVALRWTYAEELLHGTPRHAATVRLKTGVKRDGRLWAREGVVTYNGGAYASMKPNPEGNMTGGLQLGGSYRIPNTRLESRCIYTNQVPGGYMRAPGETQVHFAVESHVDMIARELGIDPLEFRLRNCLQEGDTTPNGLKLRDVRAQDVLERAREIARWGQPGPVKDDGKLRGKGVALGDRHTGTATAATKVRLNQDGTVTAITVLMEVGPGVHTILKQITAEELEVDPDLVRVEQHDTDEVPFDTGVKGASATYSSGTSVQRSARALVDILIGRAAAEWGLAPEALEWREGGVERRGRSAERMDLLALARLNPEQPAIGTCTYTPDGHPDVLSFQAQVAEVAVDPVTGQVQIERLVSVHDVARVINPVTHQGQIEGSVAQGFGYALMEDLSIAEGQILTPSLGDYKLPNIRDVPPLHTEYVQTGVGPAPFDAKGIGESGLSTVAPAVASAVYDATGVRITELPITSEKILAGLARRRTEEAA